ncbi:ribosome maturation factor RimP [Actinoplanes sp. NPDC049802]|uniref:ribosome maturation factor RimP n=1 Tax=Actinoplanes sp. NPDC049802 TaxID=3154742 RepID=UPI0033DFEEDE
MTQRGRAGARPGGRPGSRRTRPEPDTRNAPAQPRVDLGAARSRIRAVIEPVVAEAGYDLEDLTLSRAGRRFVVRVLIDTDGGVGLDDVAVVSREISEALDLAEESGGELLAGEYQLEVGSPGVDRPLTEPRHWRRNIGRLVAVGGLTGRVIEVTESGVTLDVDGQTHELGFAGLGPGKVQIEFKRMDEADFGDEDGEEDDDEGEGGE